MKEKGIERKLRQVMKKHILGIFLAAAVYNADATLNFLLQKNFLAATLGEFFSLATDSKYEYERKLFITGIARLCQIGGQWPEDVRPQLLQAMGNLLDRIEFHDKLVNEELRKQAK